MKQPTFVAWTDSERRAFVSRLGSGIVCPVTVRTWQRWRQRAREGDATYAAFIDELNRRVRDHWREG